MSVSPFRKPLVTDIAAAAAAADAYGIFPPAPAGTVVEVKVIPMAAINTTDTESRTFNLYNRTRSKTVATLALVAAVADIVDNVPFNLTLSAIADNLVVNDGDILEAESLHVGATGLAAPAVKVQVKISGSY
jgi:hypothetical protein